MKKDLKEIELIVDSVDNDMVTAMGFVEMPAIEKDFIYFGENKQNYVMAKVDVEEGIIVSPALIPEKRIYRYNPETNEEFNVFFSRETIRTLSMNFLKLGNQNNATEQHKTEIEGMYMIYSWLVENQHDPIITKYGFKDIPDGTWVVMYKVENEDIKKKIKNGDIKGLSIEAFLSEKFSSENEDEQDRILVEKLKNLLINM